MCLLSSTSVFSPASWALLEPLYLYLCHFKFKIIIMSNSNLPFYTMVPRNQTISFFGILGYVARRKLRAAIHDQYPLLRDEVHHGLAALVGDVAVEIDSGSAQSQCRNGESRKMPEDHHVGERA